MRGVASEAIREHLGLMRFPCVFVNINMRLNNFVPVVFNIRRHFGELFETPAVAAETLLGLRRRRLGRSRTEREEGREKEKKRGLFHFPAFVFTSVPRVADR